MRCTVSRYRPRYLEGNLETYILGNHLFSNAKSLVFAGLFFEGEEAAHWLAKGLALLRREMAEQILPDGGHFERSPMYHCMILEDLLDLINLTKIYWGTAGAACKGFIPSWEEAGRRMLAWLHGMCHPDGEIALFNDAAFGVTPSPAELKGYALRLGLGPAVSPRDGITHFAESGYVCLQGEGAVVILDVGILGPDYLPAHGHADTLSFELSLARAEGDCRHRYVLPRGLPRAPVPAEHRVTQHGDRRRGKFLRGLGKLPGCAAG